jgi:chromosome segregation ATPase
MNIKITPVKNILVNPIYGFVEHFNPELYTPEQIQVLKKKGYRETVKTASDTEKQESQVDSRNNNSSDPLNNSSDPLNNSSSSSTIGKISTNSDTGMDRTKKQLQKTSSTDIIENRNFINSSTNNFDPSLQRNNLDNKAMTDKLQEADRKFNELKKDINLSSESTIYQLRTEYEQKMKNWSEDYKKSIQYYKEYIKNQEKWMKDLEKYNIFLLENIQKNDKKLDLLAQKWDESQAKINNYESRLLHSDSDKNKVIRELQKQLDAERSRKVDIDDKIAKLREEKDKLDRAYHYNLKKLKESGLGNTCPKDFNRNDYIHKKKIPCWGCIL